MAGDNEDGMNRCYGYPEFAKKKNINLWYLGPHMGCERFSDGLKPTDALVTWNDGVYTFALRTRKDTDLSDDLLPEADLAHPKRNWKSIYTIGDAAFCKADKREMAAQSREHNLILRVKELEPQIPLPETIYTWKDDECFWHITRRVPGETLRDAWLGLTDAQREVIAEEVVQHAHALAKHTSPRIEGGLGAPKGFGFLFLPPKIMDADEAKAHFSPIPDSEGPFILAHGDLNPTNIIVKDGRLAAIIDWETLRYEPPFWQATQPAATILLGFDPEIYEDIKENNAWGFLLSRKLVDLGHPVQGRAWQDWARERGGS